MIKIKNISVLIVFLLAITGIQAQTYQLKKAEEKFEKLAYIDAISIYENLVESGYANTELFSKLGDAYYFNANYKESLKWYTKLFELEPKQTPEYNFRYGQSLKSNNEYEKADKYLANYFKSQGMPYTNYETLLEEINKVNDRYTIKKVGFNSEYSDYPAFYKADSLYVISADKTLKKTPWNDEPTSDIFTLNRANLNPIESDINTAYNEGSLVITNDGKTMYFTRNDYLSKKLGRDSKRITRLKLYKATKKEGLWVNTEELPFNSNQYSVGHPALSPDNTKLYFVSDMPGGKGGTDIYETVIYPDGTFTEPINMSTFNTTGNEMFPFIANDGAFYFSSNGHSNLGGMDVFISKGNQDGVYGTAYNVGKPINSPFDDFAFVIDENEGYFSTNRDHANDDIYKFKETIKFEEPCYMTVHGIVKDKKTGDLLPNSRVSLLNTNNIEIASMITNEDARYSFNKIDCSKAKFVRAEKPSYQSNEVSLAGTKGDNYNEILLDKRNIPTSIGTDIGQLINPIFFDLDRHNIRPDAQVELEKIVVVMKQYPDLKIDVRSHTDSRASASYNMKLSDRRAKSTIEYITSRGIDKARLTGRGYGESQLLNNCADGVECSDEKHQENRRSEFIIIK